MGFAHLHRIAHGYAGFNKRCALRLRCCKALGCSLGSGSLRLALRSRKAGLRALAQAVDYTLAVSQALALRCAQALRLILFALRSLAVRFFLDALDLLCTDLPLFCRLLRALAQAVAHALAVSQALALRCAQALRLVLFVLRSLAVRFFLAALDLLYTDLPLFCRLLRVSFSTAVRLRCAGRFRTHIRRTLRGRRLLLLIGCAGSIGLGRRSHFHLFFLDDDLDILVGRCSLLLDLLLRRVRLTGIDVHSICRSSTADGKACCDRTLGKFCNFAGELSLSNLTGFLFPLDPQKPKAGGDSIEPLAVLLFLLYLRIAVEFDSVLVLIVEVHIVTLRIYDVCQYLQAYFLMPDVNDFPGVLVPGLQDPAALSQLILITIIGTHYMVSAASIITFVYYYLFRAILFHLSTIFDIICPIFTVCSQKLQKQITRFDIHILLTLCLCTHSSFLLLYPDAF